MQKLVILCATVAVSLAFLVAPMAAVADDLVPPWWRGEWSTTSQIWEFMIPEPGVPGQVGVPPDGPAPGGQPPLPSTMLWVEPGPGMEWLQEDQGRIGVWPLSGWIEVIVDNHDPKPENEKWIQVQLTWREQDPGSGVRPEFGNLNPEPILPPKLIEEIQFADGWTHSTYFWKLDWNPPDEMFGFGGMINVDELVVDTWCIPEPGTLVSLAGLGVMGLFIGLYRRRNK